MLSSVRSPSVRAFKRSSIHWFKRSSFQVLKGSNFQAFRVQACLTLTFGWHVKQEFRTALRIYQSAVDVGVSATDAEMSELVKVPDAAAAECVPHTRPRAHTHVLPKRPARLTRAAPPFAQLRVR